MNTYTRLLSVPMRLAALAAIILAAQNAAAQDEFPATLRVATRLTAEAPLDEAYWASSLDRAIARSPRVIDVRRASVGDGLSETKGNIITVDVVAKPVGENVKTEWRLIDPVDGSTFASGTEEGTAPSTRDLDELQWIPLVEALENWDALLIEAPPGTTIKGIGKEEVRIGESGKAKVLLKIPETYRWSARKSGMATENGILVLPNGNVPLKIQLSPLRLWAMEIGVRLAFFPEFRLARGYAEDRLFLRAGFDQSIWAFKPGSGEDELFVSAYGGRFEPSVGYGVYFFNKDHRLRPYAAMDLSLRLVHTKDAYLYFDLPDAFRLTPALGLELSGESRYSAFLETGIDLAGSFDDTFGDFNAKIGTRFRF